MRCPRVYGALGVRHDYQVFFPSVAPLPRRPGPRAMSPSAVEASVVVVGKFAPSNRIVADLARVEALPKGELEAAEVVALLHHQFAEVNFSWGRLMVTRDRLQVDARQAPYVRAADLVAKYIREIEPTSSARAAGINTTTHYMFLDAAKRNALASSILNFPAWGDWGRDVLASLDSAADGVSTSGVTGVVVRQGGRHSDREAGYIDTRVEPGPPSPNGFEVLIRINDHFELDNTIEPPRSDAVRTTLVIEQVEKCFDASVARSLGIADGIVGGSGA